jgi:type I restriction enzyme M protein
MSKFQEISSLIWKISDDVLRMKFKENEYGEVILPFVLLRRLDCVLEPNKDEIYKLYEEYKSKVDDPTPIIINKINQNFYNVSKYDLSKLTSDPKNTFINFKNYLNGYSTNIHEIIENFQLDKIIEKLHKNNLLYLLVNSFTEIDLHPNVVDNHTMGMVFEELLRKSSELSNESSGQYYTPRDIVKLLVSLVFSGSKEDLKGEGKIRSVFDPCCGTGGMLTIGKEWVLGNINPNLELKLFGQETISETYSICKSDILISGENPDNIKLGSSLSEDGFQGFKFDYMITNPPFGVSWKSEEDFIKNESQNPQGRFSVGTPRTSDGSLLFLQHMISKMETKGSRIGVVFNGSPLFTGDSGSGESEIRKWVIENDLLECIVQLPDSIFFNTGITSYIWIVNNNKKSNRKGFVQLIDGSNLFKPMKKSLGSKRKEVSNEQRDFILKNYTDFKETEISKIFPNEFFGYTKVTIEQPLKENGDIIKDKKGVIKTDSSLRDYERIPLGVDIDEYFEREVKPHLPESWMDRNKDNIGYEINFTKYFYKYKPLRSLGDLTKELLDLEKESDGLMNKLIE